jgi:cytochrome b involved in lipid metabolism
VHFFNPTSLLAISQGYIIGPLVAEEQTDDIDDPITHISWEELKLHSTADDCWVAMHGGVYDLTAYANLHPGGADFITSYAGTDCTDDYDIFHLAELY